MPETLLKFLDAYSTKYEILIEKNINQKSVVKHENYIDSFKKTK